MITKLQNVHLSRGKSISSISRFKRPQGKERASRFNTFRHILSKGVTTEKYPSPFFFTNEITIQIFLLPL